MRKTIGLSRVSRYDDETNFAPGIIDLIKTVSQQPIRIVIIGAGAAGMVAAAEAANAGADVVLLEKNTKTGVKILMSGGTRCNLTHDTNAQGITQAFGHAKRFLQPSVGAFPPAAVVGMFRELGVETKVETTGKVFPKSNRAVQVRDALQQRAIQSGAKIILRCGVRAIQSADQGNRWSVATENETFHCDRLIITAGGKSWPGCGTTGDAYDWLRALGHKIVNPRPALVPLVGGDAWMNELSGVTLADCVGSVRSLKQKGKPLLQRRSSFLFTHFGFSGPVAMDVSGVITQQPSFADSALTLDLLPEISAVDVDRVLSDRSAGGKQTVRNVLEKWLPNRLAQAIAIGTGGNQSLAELPKKSKRKIVACVKELPLPVTGTKGFAKAEVTAGGVSLREVDPKTMESRIVRNLFIAGEVLDVDGWIGGYNFQAAFSTGRAAGIAASRVG